MTTFLLYESASGFGLFEVTNFDEIGNSVDELQQSIIDVSRFGKNVKLIAFKPFTSAANALEQINAISESQVMHAPIEGPVMAFMVVSLEPYVWCINWMIVPSDNVDRSVIIISRVTAWFCRYIYLAWQCAGRSKVDKWRLGPDRCLIRNFLFHNLVYTLIFCRQRRI